jgi:hypothetical protein
MLRKSASASPAAMLRLVEVGVDVRPGNDALEVARKASLYRFGGECHAP